MAFGPWMFAQIEMKQTGMLARTLNDSNGLIDLSPV